VRKQHLSANSVSAKVRWLCLLAGISSATLGIACFGPSFLIYGVFLLLGVIVQPRAPTTGRWLSWTGAILLSVGMVPYCVRIVFDAGQLLSSRPDALMVLLYSLAVASMVLIISCDVALVDCGNWFDRLVLLELARRGSILSASWNDSFDVLIKVISDVSPGDMPRCRTCGSCNFKQTYELTRRCRLIRSCDN